MTLVARELPRDAAVDVAVAITGRNGQLHIALTERPFRLPLGPEDPDVHVRLTYGAEGVTPTLAQYAKVMVLPGHEGWGSPLAALDWAMCRISAVRVAVVPDSCSTLVGIRDGVGPVLGTDDGYLVTVTGPGTAAQHGSVLYGYSVWWQNRSYDAEARCQGTAPTPLPPDQLTFSVGGQQESRLDISDVSRVVWTAPPPRPDICDLPES